MKIEKMKIKICLVSLGILLNNITVAQPGAGNLDLNIFHPNSKLVIFDTSDVHFEGYKIMAYVPKNKNFEKKKTTKPIYPKDFQEAEVGKPSTCDTTYSDVGCRSASVGMNRNNMIKVIITKDKDTMVLNFKNLPFFENSVFIDSIYFKKGIFEVNYSNLNAVFIDTLKKHTCNNCWYATLLLSKNDSK